MDFFNERKKTPKREATLKEVKLLRDQSTYVQEKSCLRPISPERP
jgi:hypothetical protein